MADNKNKVRYVYYINRHYQDAKQLSKQHLVKFI